MSANLLLWGVIIAGPFFVIVFVIEGWLRKNYNPIRQPVSALSQGPRGWIQKYNFFISGILVVASAFGLPSALQSYGGSFWAPLLVGLYGVGIFGAGVFLTDAAATVEDDLKFTKRTRAGILHDICSVFVFGSLFAVSFVFANLFYSAGEWGWHLLSIVTGILYGLGFLLFARGFSPRGGGLAPIAGLLQRLTISLGALWLSLVALHLLGLL